jgi:TRAP-type C4-dicarboxylate transport system substrate-binding protein
MKMNRALRLVVVAALGFVMVHASPARAEPIVLKGITPWVQSYYWCEPLLMFQRMVNSNKKLKGKVIVSYLGANEVVPTFEQFEAVRNGSVDLILGAASYYSGQIPEAMAVQYAKLSPTQLRKSGFYDLMRKLHDDAGVVYLANTGGSPGKAFRMFVNKNLTKPDFTGLKIRVTPVYISLVKAFGGTPINMAPSEVYSALERKVVDGYGWSYGGITDFGWQEVTKHVIDIPFYSANTAIIFNKKTWDGLPQDVRDELEKIGMALEAKAEKFMANYIMKEDTLLRGLGVNFLNFSDADTKLYVETAYSAGWKAYLAKNPTNGPKLKAMSE